MPKRTIFDNAAVAVSEVLGAYVTKETKRYEELKAHYQFNTTYCNPRSGNEVCIKVDAMTITIHYKSMKIATHER